MFGYLEVRMGTCINCLWFLLLCKFSVAVPWGKLYAPDGLTNSSHLFAVSEVALVCRGHSGSGAWQGEVDPSKGSWEAAVFVKSGFYTSRLAEKSLLWAATAGGTQGD